MTSTCRGATTAASPRARRRSLFAGLSVPWWIGSTLVCVGPSAAAQSGSGTEPCSWEVASRQLLSLGPGTLAYVEPRSLSGTRNGVLLLGSPSYVWAQGRGPGAAVPRDSVLGAVIDESGHARAVPTPLPGAEVRGLSAAGNEDGTWSVAFTVVRPGTRFPDDEVAARLGFGSFDGRGWRNVETEPLPEDVALNPMRPSRLVKVGDAFLWALPTRARAANAGVAILRRVKDDWLLSVDAPTRVFGLSVAYIPAWGEVVGVARADTVGAVPRGTLRVESVALGGGAASAFPIDPGRGNLWDPVFDRGKDPRWIGWLSEAGGADEGRLEARAVPLYPPDGQRTVLIVDSSSAALHPIGVEDDGASYWISHHAGGESVIALVRTLEAGVQHLFAMTNPFDGPFGAVRRGPFRILLAGPVMGRDPGSPPVTTLTVDLRRSCRGRT